MTIFRFTFFLIYFAEPEPPTKPTTCDYGQYCALADCSKAGAADLCPDQCSKYSNSFS